MKYYLAPLESVTNLYYRRQFYKHFNSVDKYFIPFLDPKNKNLHKKELKEIDPKNNQINAKVVPQIISKDSEGTIWLINLLNGLGYDEINLNFGCPSGTVTAKNKGAGIFKNLDLMDKYLEEVFKNTKSKISIKMRIGINDDSHFDEIINILNKYDIYELIIHPRTGLEKYSGNLHLNLLDDLDKKTKFDIIYNGEVNSKEDIEYIKNRFPYLKGIMLGRGLLSRPDLLNEEIDDIKRLNRIKDFYYDLSKENIEIFGWGGSNFFHKQLWYYMINMFDVDKKMTKKLFKSKEYEEFQANVKDIFDNAKFSDEISGIKKYLFE